jgi:hypothetical protein
MQSSTSALRDIDDLWCKTWIQIENGKSRKANFWASKLQFWDSKQFKGCVIVLQPDFSFSSALHFKLSNVPEHYELKTVNEHKSTQEKRITSYVNAPQSQTWNFQLLHKILLKKLFPCNNPIHLRKFPVVSKANFSYRLAAIPRPRRKLSHRDYFILASVISPEGRLQSKRDKATHKSSRSPISPRFRSKLYPIIVWLASPFGGWGPAGWELWR